VKRWEEKEVTDFQAGQKNFKINFAGANKLATFAVPNKTGT
jgi:hypothetical protein